MKNRIKYLDELRLFAILNIILLHVIAIFRWKYFGNSSSNYFLWSFLDAFTRFSIPVFFMLTGILMFEKKEEKYLVFLKKRVLKLILSYFLFCILYYLFDVLVENHSFSINEFIRLSTADSIKYHLWFMPVIILIYSLIPFIKKIAIHSTKKELKTMILVVFILGNCLGGVSYFLQAFNHYALLNFILPNLMIYMNYCFLGYYLYKYDVKIEIKHVVFCIISIIAMPIMTLIVSKNSINDCFLDSISPLVLLPTGTIFLYFKNRKDKKSPLWWNKLLEHTTPIIMYVYFIHVMFLSIYQKVLTKPLSSKSFFMDLCCFVILFILTTISSFIYAFIWTSIKKWFIKNYEKIMNICIQILIYFLILLFTIIIGNFLINPYHFIKLNYLGLIIGMISYIGLFYLLYKYQEKIFKYKTINIIMILFYIIFQIIIIYCFMVEPSWDFGEVYKIAIDFALSSTPHITSDYLYICDNNIGISLLLDAIFKIGSFIGLKNHLLLLGIATNCIFIDISFVYCYLLLKKINEKISKPFFFFCLFFIPLIFYLPIFYTDTISLPFVVIPLYYFYQYFFVKQKVHYIIISGLLFGIGGVLKPTVLIPLVAIFLFMILEHKKYKKINYRLFIPTLLGCVIVPFLGYKMIVNFCFEKELFELSRLPMNHYIMIGLEKTGDFSQEAVEYTMQYSGEEARKKASNERIKKRLEEMVKNHELLSFYNRKISYTWTDGTFFSFEKLRREPYHKEYTKYVYSEDNSSFLYWMISNTSWFLLLIFMGIGLIFRKYLPKELKSFQLLLNISIIGLFLFLLIWETRSRYLVNYSILFLWNAFIGINAIIEYRKNKRGRRA